jgi:peptide/nickel transport system ATP-binding protein
METRPFVTCDNLVKIYKVADLEVIALQGLDLEVGHGEMVALVGPSGSGKSTLLNVIGGLDVPTAGEVQVDGRDLLKMDERDRVQYKREAVGFVWQQPSRNLLPYLTARENVEMPMVLSGRPGGERSDRARELLEVVGLEERGSFRPDQLSGGEQQRAALAVALANNPTLLLGDELTGQIDSDAARQVYDALHRINDAYGTTIILVTHDLLVSRLVDRVVAIRDGRTSTEIRRSRDRDDGTIQEEEEWVILDQAGRLQLPGSYVEALEMAARVKVRLEPDHVSIWPGIGQPGGNGRPADNVSGETGLSLPRRTGTGASSAVTATGLSRTFELGVERVDALQGVNLRVPNGSLVAIVGRSGSGKTTLLNLVAGLDEPTSGQVAVNGRVLSDMPGPERIELRRKEIGFVYQTFGLLPFLSVEENVQVPLRLLRMSHKERRGHTTEVLGWVGLLDRAKHRVYELSGGEQQRVAIARALVKQPSLLLADEPTGQLDTATGAEIVALLKEIVRATGITVVIASHDPKVREAADWVLELRDGRLVGWRRCTAPNEGNGQDGEK